MKVTDIVELESSRRGVEGWRCIHLIASGQFYHANDVSAWLFLRHVKKFSVVNRFYKDVDRTVPFVGFPLGSLKDNQPDDVEVDDSDKDHIIWKLPAPDPGAPFDEEALRKAFEEWRKSLPVKEEKEKGKGEAKPKAPPQAKDTGATTPSPDSADNPYPLPAWLEAEVGMPRSLSEILRALIAAPFERMSPMDCQALLRRLRQCALRLW